MITLNAKKVKLFSTSVVLMFLSTLFYMNCSRGGFSTSGLNGGTDLASSDPSAVSIVFTKVPLNMLNANSLSFSYEISGQNLSSVSAKCYLDQTLQADCSSPIDLTSMPDGDYTLTVDATNQNSLVLATAKRSFRLDRRAPVLAINQAPSGTINTSSASVAFSMTDNFPGVVASCSLDNAVFVSCSSPYSVSNLAQGAHNVKIYAQDAAGNKSATQTISFSVNTAIAIPTVAISQMPAAFSNSASASFSFSGSSSGSTIASYQCSLDSAAFAACSSPQSYSSLAEGSHSFAVKAVDASGQSSSVANYSFSVDVTKPSTPSVSSDQMNPSKLTSLNLTFNSTDASGVAKYECKLDAGSFAACVSPQAFSGLSSASHSFAVRATDKAGNVSAEGSYSIVIDTVAPVVTISSQPASSTQSTSASFAFSVSDALSGVNLIECQLDSLAYANCSSPQSYSNLAVGSHNFNLRGTDKAGNSSVQSYSWSIAAAPTPTPTATPIQDPTPPPAGGVPLLEVDVEDMEFIGPFPSWVNVKSLGAVGNGVADDTAAIQNGLNQIGHSADKAILYFPSGTYRITQTLNYNGTNSSYGNSIGVIGQDPATTTVVYDGAAGGNMLVVNGGVGHRFERITWDGKSKANIGLALWWDASTNANYGGTSQTTDEVFKDMAIGIMAGRMGANYGQLDSEGKVRRTQFIRMSKAGITTGSWNALDWWIFDSQFIDCAIGVTNLYTEGGNGPSAGNFLLYRNLFMRSTQADFWIANGGWFSALSNVSIGSKRFYNAQLSGPSGAQVIIQKNRIIDPTDPTPIYIGNLGPVTMIDNQIRSLAGSAGPVVKLANGSYASDLISVGNTFTISNMLAKTNSGDRILTISDQVVSASAISGAAPTMPGTAPSKGRQIFEVGSTVNASTIQAAINNAVNSGSDNAIVHIAAGSYSINSTITIPAGKRIQLAGDSFATILGWSGSSGSMISLPGPSLATVRDMSINFGSATGINLTNADQAGGRVFGGNSAFGVTNITNLASTRVAFQGNAGFDTLNISGSKSVLSVGSGNAFPVNMSNNSSVCMYDSWYEGARGKLWGATDGTYTLSGGHLAPSDSTVHGGTSTDPSFNPVNFSGKLTLIGVAFDIETTNNRIAIGAENSNTNILMLGLYGNQIGYFDRSSSGGNVGLVSSHFTDPTNPSERQNANVGSTDSNFILGNLAQTRSVVWDTVPATIPAGATDVKVFGVFMVNGSGTALNISK